MVLYAADVIDLTPKVDEPVKPKRVRKPKKAKVEAETVSEPVKETVKETVKEEKAPEEVVIETVITEPVEVPKKRKRDTEKAQQARKAKKEEMERVKLELETLKQKLENQKSDLKILQSGSNLMLKTYARLSPQRLGKRRNQKKSNLKLWKWLKRLGTMDLLETR